MASVDRKAQSCRTKLFWVDFWPNRPLGFFINDLDLATSSYFVAAFWIRAGAWRFYSTLGRCGVVCAACIPVRKRLDLSVYIVSAG